MTEKKRFRLRGVIEGFYGRPWTHAERLDILDFMGNWHLNCYIYAPKDDPIHRHRWQEEYPAEAVGRFKELIAATQNNGVSFCYAVSPGLSITYSNSAHLSRLIKKLRRFQRLGVQSFGLFFDDIPPYLVHVEDQAEFESLAQAQAQLTNKVYEALKNEDNEAQLLLCPTEYQGEGDSPYLHQLGELLHSDVAVMWTGKRVVSPQINPEDLQKLKQVIRQPVIFWDNYPVNDAMMTPELHIGPYTGRSPELVSLIDGLVANPMPLPEASKVGIANVAQYLWDPFGYDYRNAWKKSLQSLVPAEVSGSFYRFAQANTYSPLNRTDPEHIKDAIYQYHDGLNAMDFTDAPNRLLDFFQQMVEDARALQQLPPELLDEIRPWLVEFEQWGYLGMEAVQLIRAIFAYFHDPTVDKAEVRKEVRKHRDAIAKGLVDSIEFKTKVCGEAVRNFLQDVYRATPNLVRQILGA